MAEMENVDYQGYLERRSVILGQKGFLQFDSERENTNP